MTNKDNYQRYAKYLVGKRKIKTESELMDNLNLVSERLDLAIDSGGWEWNIDKKAHFQSKTNKEKFNEILDKPLNELADYGWAYRYRISKLLNGGNNGWQERIIYYLTLEKHFNCSNKSKEIKSEFKESVKIGGNNVGEKNEMLKKYNENTL